MWGTLQVIISVTNLLVVYAASDWRLGLKNSAYKIVNELMTQSEAKEACTEVDDGLHLLYLETRDEINFIKKLLTDTELAEHEYWIGLETNSNWHWNWASSEGHPIELAPTTDWGPKLPRNKTGYRCAFMRRKYEYDNKWKDEICNDHMAGYICEAQAPNCSHPENSPLARISTNHTSSTYPIKHILPFECNPGYEQHEKTVNQAVCALARDGRPDGRWIGWPATFACREVRSPAVLPKIDGGFPWAIVGPLMGSGGAIVAAAIFGTIIYRRCRKTSATPKHENRSSNYLEAIPTSDDPTFDDGELTYEIIREVDMIGDYHSIHESDMLDDVIPPYTTEEKAEPPPQPITHNAYVYYDELSRHEQEPSGGTINYITQLPSDNISP